MKITFVKKIHIPIRNRTIEISDKLHRYFVFFQKTFKITKYTEFISKNSIIENVIFVIIEVIAWILLTIQIFGDMNPDAIIISANILGIGLIGTCTCNQDSEHFKNKINIVYITKSISAISKKSIYLLETERLK